MSPCARVESSAAISTFTANPSGRMIRGPAGAGWVGMGGGGEFTPQATKMIAASIAITVVVPDMNFEFRMKNLRMKNHIHPTHCDPQFLILNSKFDLISRFPPRRSPPASYRAG